VIYTLYAKIVSYTLGTVVHRLAKLRSPNYAIWVYLNMNVFNNTHNRSVPMSLMQTPSPIPSLP